MFSVSKTDPIFIKINTLLNQTDVIYQDNMVEKMCALVHLLIKWSKALNLTAIKNEDDIIVLHILDSAVISPFLTYNKIADVGTGAGFPGLVLAILNPDKKFTLIDSVAKKIAFVKTAAVELNLDNVEVINNRCENLTNLDKFDIIVSRAFAPLQRMINWCLPLLKDEGFFLAMKANLEQTELEEVPATVKIEKIKKLHVPNLDANRQAVFIKKVI